MVTRQQEKTYRKWYVYQQMPPYMKGSDGDGAQPLAWYSCLVIIYKLYKIYYEE